MGVRKYYILNHRGMYYTGPNAYKMILKYANDFRKMNATARTPIYIPTPNALTGWRKKIEILYKPLEGIMFEKGALQVVSSRNGHSNHRYRGILEWVNSNVTKLRTPGGKPLVKEFKLK